MALPGWFQLKVLGMKIGTFVRQLLIASIALGIVASNPRAGGVPGPWIYSCTIEYGLMWEDGQIKELTKLWKFGSCL